MADINQIISLGLGSPADIAFFIRDGLSASAGVTIPFEDDLNTRLWVYLIALGSTLEDLTTMIAQALSADYSQGEWTARLLALIADATAAMV